MESKDLKPGEIASLLTRRLCKQIIFEQLIEEMVLTLTKMNWLNFENLEKKKRRLETEGAIETLVWKDASEPKPTHILIRGEYDKPGESVERDTPAALPPLPARMEGRTPTRGTGPPKNLYQLARS